MKTLPFRFKIALLSACLSGVVIVAFGTVAYLVVVHQKSVALDTEIRSLGMRHRGWLSNPQAFQRISRNFESILGEGREDELIMMVRGDDGTIADRTKNWPAEIDPTTLDTRLEPDPRPEEPGSHGPGGGLGPRSGWGWGNPGHGPGRVSFNRIPRFESIGNWRLGMFGRDDRTLVIGLDTRHMQGELAELRNSFLLALGPALLLIGAGGWLVACRALRPLRSIARTAEQVTARGLDQRIPSSDEDPEISRVIQVLNLMMDRLERSFQQATRFSADASHELKTPLAVMQGELENALQEAAPGSREQQMFAGLLEETQQLKTITGGLLLLARADAGQLQLTKQSVDLGAMIERLVEDAKTLAEGMNLEFAIESGGRVVADVDPGLLHTALLNLFVNAVKYNVEGGTVEARFKGGTDEIAFSVGNSGPGIPAEDRERVFSRFHRVDSSRGSRVDGVGLGLSLAREIARAHGGDLVLDESRPGWTVFTLRLPPSRKESTRGSGQRPPR